LVKERIRRKFASNDIGDELVRVVTSLEAMRCASWRNKFEQVGTVIGESSRGIGGAHRGGLARTATANIGKTIVDGRCRVMREDF
jgi:hypothetical protein